MILSITVSILVIVFIATRYGFKSPSKAFRIISYVGVFLSIAAMVYLLTYYVTQKFAGIL